jgi:hypothetical protein
MRFPAQIATTAVAFLLAPALLLCQDNAAGNATATSQDHPAAISRQSAPSISRVEVFLGYSGIRAVPTDTLGNRLVWLSGGGASAAINLNRYLGIVGDFGGYRDTKVRLTGAGATPAGTTDSTGSAYTYLLGPRLSYRRYQRFTPFAQALFGAVHASQVTLSGCSGPSCPTLPAENAFALTAGGGLDLRIHHRVSIRLFQAEYMMTRFADLSTGDRQIQNDVRLSSGLVVGFGSITAPAPVAYSCSAGPSSVYPGEPVTVTGTPLNLNPKKPAAYTWTSDGGTISGSTSTATVDSNSASPGTYRVVGHVTQGSKAGRSADCSSSYTVLAFQPPTVSCSATPSTIRPGGSATIQSQGTSPQQRPLTYSYSASQGSVNGSASTAVLTTAGVSPGAVTVTCNVVDDKGNTASSSALVNVEAPAEAPAPVSAQLCAIDFARDSRRPTRVDNEAKACLDNIALSMQRSSDARLAMIGHSDESEANGEKDGRNSSQTNGSNNGAQRAVNARDYLVTDKGIDASRIAAYTGVPAGKTVESILIPSGAKLDQAGLAPVDPSVKVIPRKSTANRTKRR